MAAVGGRPPGSIFSEAAEPDRVWTGTPSRNRVGYEVRWILVGLKEGKMRVEGFCAVAGFSVLLVAASVPQGATAQDALITRHRLPVALAQKAANAALDACRAKGFSVSAAVVDADGGLHVALRDDNAGIQTVESAIDKATTSAVFGVDSGYWVDRNARGEPISPLLNQLPKLLLAKGGLVIKVGGEVVGGIAVGGAPGGDIDEACAKVGREALLQSIPRSER